MPMYTPGRLSRSAASAAVPSNECTTHGGGFLFHGRVSAAAAAAPPPRAALRRRKKFVRGARVQEHGRPVRSAISKCLNHFSCVSFAQTASGRNPSRTRRRRRRGGWRRRRRRLRRRRPAPLAPRREVHEPLEVPLGVARVLERVAPGGVDAHGGEQRGRRGVAARGGGGSVPARGRTPPRAETHPPPPRASPRHARSPPPRRARAAAREKSAVDLLAGIAAEHAVREVRADVHVPPGWTGLRPPGPRGGATSPRARFAKPDERGARREMGRR